MSRNFEILHEDGEDRELFPDSDGKIEAPVNGGSRDSQAGVFVHDEEVRLVQRLFLLSNPRTFRTVVFCGVAREDGASSICANAGKILSSQAGGTVCIVDADVRDPQLHMYFRVSNRRGLSDALLHSDPVRNYVQKLAVANLWLMPCGPVPTGQNNSLSHDQLRQRMEELRSEFGYVLIHAPPANLSEDAILLGQSADGLVLVVKANSTHREAARKAKDRLQLGSVTLLMMFS